MARKNRYEEYEELKKGLKLAKPNTNRYEAPIDWLEKAIKQAEQRGAQKKADELLGKLVIDQGKGSNIRGRPKRIYRKNPDEKRWKIND